MAECRLQTKNEREYGIRAGAVYGLIARPGCRPKLQQPLADGDASVGLWRPFSSRKTARLAEVAIKTGGPH
jgi:hypothetical protein